MNLPVNNPVLEGVFLDQIKPSKLFYDLKAKNFNGFIQLTVDGKYGFEEAVIIFNRGNIIGDIYIIEGYDIDLYGEDAFGFCINSFGAKAGILNIFALTVDQLKLILIFNEKIRFIKPILTEKRAAKKKKYFLNNITYDENKITKLLEKKIIKEPSQKELLNEVGLDALVGSSKKK